MEKSSLWECVCVLTCVCVCPSDLWHQTNYPWLPAAAFNDFHLYKDPPLLLFLLLFLFSSTPLLLSFIPPLFSSFTLSSSPPPLVSLLLSLLFFSSYSSLLSSSPFLPRPPSPSLSSSTLFSFWLFQSFLLSSPLPFFIMFCWLWTDHTQVSVAMFPLCVFIF